MSRRLRKLFAITAVAVATCSAATFAMAGQSTPAQPTQADLASEVATLKDQVAVLQKRVPPPELGQQMLELQIRHDRLWWAGQAHNWTLAYFMVGELGEALRGIEESNGDAPEVQPQKLSELMPSIMNPAIKGVQKALEARDINAFDTAYDRLSTSCNACHQAVGAKFLHIQRPQTKLLDNLRYAAPAK